MAWETITTFIQDKFDGLSKLGQYLDYLKDLQIVMALVGIFCCLTGLALLVLTISHYFPWRSLTVGKQSRMRYKLSFR